MDIKSSEIIIGIDAGGAKTRVIVGNREQFETSTVLENYFGSANFREVRVKGIQRLGSEIIKHFSINSLESARVVGGFAGAGTAESQSEIAQAFESLGFVKDNIFITSDASLILLALKNRGVALIAGTGGICVGCNSDADGFTQANMVRAGGYGYRVDSEASGYYLGRRAIDLALKIFDGRKQDPSELFQIVREGLGLEDFRELTSRIYHSDEDSGSVQSLIASLAPRVLECAERGDRAASEIVNDLVFNMADHIQAVCSKLQLNSTSVALHGGLFKSPHSLELIINPLKKHALLSDLALTFFTVGVSSTDLDGLIEAVKFLL